MTSGIGGQPETLISGTVMPRFVISLPMDTAPVGLGAAFGNPPKLAQVPTATIRPAFLAASRNGRPRFGRR